MSYRKGDLKLAWHGPDGRADAEGHVRHGWCGMRAKLPHSCDEWVVGGVEEIDLLMADLAAARTRILAGQPPHPDDEYCPKDYE